MRLSHFTLAFALLFAVVLGQQFAESEEGKTDPQAARMERIKKIRSPGPQHEAMKFFEGTWDVAWSFVMNQPDGKSTTTPPTPMTSTFRWVIPGRWMSEEMKSLKPIPYMGDYHGFLLHGYDNHTKNYVSCGVTNGDTSMNMFRGVKVDPNDKVFTQYGTINEWLDDTFNKPVKVQIEKVDENCFHAEIWDLQIGANGKPVIKMKYTRKK